jgi:hypothetical protein
MPVKLADTIARVIKSIGDEPVGRGELVALAVRATIEAIGFHVAHDGEICDPRPDPKFMPPGMEAKWGGGSRRRRR